jgi:hypothetical protein
MRKTSNNRDDLMRRLHVADQKVTHASDEREAALVALAESHWNFHEIIDDPATDEADEVAAANYDDEMLHWTLAANERYRNALAKWSRLRDRVNALEGKTSDVTSGNNVVRLLH